MTPLQQSCIDFASNPVAAGVTWKDTTMDNETPNSFQTDIGECEICIFFEEDRIWYYCCESLQLYMAEIPNATTAQEAATQAYQICKDKVSELYKAFNPEK